MLEKFQNWIDIKFQIHKKDNRVYFNEREIWWTNIGQNVGDEEYGKGNEFLRPVIVIRKFNKRICLCIPTSTSLKNNPYYYHFEFKNRKLSALILQIRVLDVKRFKRRQGRMSKSDFKKLKNKIIETTL